jgi:hypothetical protein
MTTAGSYQEATVKDAAAAVVVQDNPDNRTYEARQGDQVVGTLVYEAEGPRVVLTHTFVEPSRREQGIATTLSRGALDDLRAKGKTVTIYCSFVSDFISKHPEYADLIDPAHPGRPQRL